MEQAIAEGRPVPPSCSTRRAMAGASGRDRCASAVRGRESDSRHHHRHRHHRPGPTCDAAAHGVRQRGLRPADLRQLGLHHGDSTPRRSGYSAAMRERLLDILAGPSRRATARRAWPRRCRPSATRSCAPCAKVRAARLSWSDARARTAQCAGCSCTRSAMRRTTCPSPA